MTTAQFTSSHDIASAFEALQQDGFRVAYAISGQEGSDSSYHSIRVYSAARVLARVLGGDLDESVLDEVEETVDQGYQPEGFDKPLCDGFKVRVSSHQNGNAGKAWGHDSNDLDIRLPGWEDYDGAADGIVYAILEAGRWARDAEAALVALYRQTLEAGK